MATFLTQVGRADRCKEDVGFLDPHVDALPPCHAPSMLLPVNVDREIPFAALATNLVLQEFRKLHQLAFDSFIIAVGIAKKQGHVDTLSNKNSSKSFVIFYASQHVVY